MRAVLQAIVEELARLKADGENHVPVSDEALAGLRALVTGPAKIAATPPANPPGSAPPATASNLPATTPSRLNPEPRPTPAPAPRPTVKLAAAVAAPSLPPPPTVTLPEGDKATRWAALLEQLATNPTVIEQLRATKKPIFASGSLDAKIVFVGDAPGLEEATSGEPFTGPAGQLLTKMIVGMGLRRDDVLIANLVCWRPLPPGEVTELNRTATAEELAFGLPFFRAALDIVQPDLVVALGGTAAQGLLGKGFTTLAAVRSQWHDFAARPLMVTYHPSYLLKSGTTKSKRAVWEDLLRVMERAALPISEKQRGYFA
jgi:uracil-DNA glycosylase